MPRDAWKNIPQGSELRVFFAAVNDLWWSKGAPDGRRIAAVLVKSRVKISQGTVNNMINGPRLPRWDTVSAVVKCLGGDSQGFLGLWRRAKQAASEEKPSPLVPKLPPLEREVMALIASGMNINDAARRLGIRNVTVRIRIANVRARYEYAGLDVSNPIKLHYAALDAGYLKDGRESIE